MTIYRKDRSAPVDYVIDWGPGWLRGAAIVASCWSAEPVGIAVAEQCDGNGRTRARIFGGEPGERYTVRSDVQLSDGRRGTRSLTLAIGAAR